MATYFPSGLRPAGRSVLFVSETGGLFIVPAAGGPPEQILLPGRDREPSAWSPDGRFAVYAEYGPAGDADIWALPMQGERTPRRLVATPAWEQEPQLSPDGKRLTYLSNVTGRDEIWATTFPDPGDPWQLTKDGVRAANWQRPYSWLPDGRLLYQVQTPGGWEARIARLAPAPGPAALLSEEKVSLPPGVSAITLVPDGRLLVLQGSPARKWRRLSIALNWTAELRKRFAPL